MLLFSNNHPDLVNGIIKHLKDVTASDLIQLQYNTSEEDKGSQTGEFFFLRIYTQTLFIVSEKKKDEKKIIAKLW